MKTLVFLALLFSFIQTAFAQVSEYEFNQAINRVREVYTPIVAAQGARLKIFADWSLDEINAFSRRPYSSYEVVIHGGMGRVSGMTADGLSLIACHEIGHHIGGFPRRTSGMNRWSSVEGQADFFAASKCLKRVLALENNIEEIKKLSIPEIVTQRCNAVFMNETESALCKRVSMAGMSAALSLSFLGNEKDPQFETPDKRELLETYPDRTGAQCALDTFFSGALCTIRAEDEEYCERPHCWFAHQP